MEEQIGGTGAPTEIVWRVTPLNTPAVVRRCNKCGAQAARFVSSGKFRVNANKRALDVWLVYKCEKCDNTWNLAVLSRVNASQMDPTLYYAFEKNDDVTATRYAFDAAVLARAGADVQWDEVDIDVDGPVTELAHAPLRLRVCAPYPLGIRLDKVLVRMTGLSRSRLKQLSEKGALRLADGRDVHKVRIEIDTLILYTPPQANA